MPGAGRGRGVGREEGKEKHPREEQNLRADEAGEATLPSLRGFLQV